MPGCYVAYPVPNHQRKVPFRLVFCATMACRWLYQWDRGYPASPEETVSQHSRLVHGPTGGKLRYPARSSNTLPCMALDTRVKHCKFCRLCPEPALFAFIWGCEPSKSGKKARECQCRMVKRKLAMSLLPPVARSLL